MPCQIGVQSPTQGNANRRVFDSENISISSKTRLVDATLTAYKLLDSAFVNQRGNPNNLEERFKIQDTDKMIKEILGARGVKNASGVTASRPVKSAKGMGPQPSRVLTLTPQTNRITKPGQVASPQNH